MAPVKRLSQAQRLVVKIGSSLLVEANTSTLKSKWLASLSEDLAHLARRGIELIVVSSGAIALGRRTLGLPAGALKLPESQAAAAVGQIALARAWAHALSANGLTAAQLLLTLGDTEDRRRYLNARATVETLLKCRAVPVINENDTVATSEIRYGDNDRLAARVATMASADLLVLLSDVDGLYSAPPQTNPSASLIQEVPVISDAVFAMAGDAGSDHARGGMRTKIEAAKIATEAGTAMVIASGHRLNPLTAIETGGRATWFTATDTPIAARKRWIAGHLKVEGRVRVDSGAVSALRAGRSLLPAGVMAVEGAFHRGDAVAVDGPDGVEIGHGLIGYDADEARLILGQNTDAIAAILGFRGRGSLIHRDDLVLKAETALSVFDEIRK